MKEKSALKNKILEYIYEALLNNEYKEKDQIKETVLAKKLNLSRAPVREALSELVSLGILEQIPNRGVFVKDISSKDIFDTYEAKGILEAYLAKSFAIYAKKEDMDKLDFFIKEMGNINNSDKKVALWGKKFHEHYLKYAKNEVLLETLEKLNKKSLLLFSKNWSKLYSREEIITRHQKIVDVLKSCDENQIEIIIKEHYLETGSLIILLN